MGILNIKEKILSLSDSPIVCSKVEYKEKSFRLSADYSEFDFNRFFEALNQNNLTGEKYKGIVFFLNGDVYLKNKTTKWEWGKW